jgi:hypothetical protein
MATNPHPEYIPTDRTLRPAPPRPKPNTTTNAKPVPPPAPHGTQRPAP